MLVDSFSGFFIGAPNFSFSQKLDELYETTLILTIPDFLSGLRALPKTTQLNEVRFSQEFVISLNRYLMNNPKGILAVADYQDFYDIDANPVKRVDIAFVSSEQKSSKIKLYTVEAKRLPTGNGREKEYVHGLFKSGSPSGGIQRFKTGDHGYGLSKSALLGYVEENDFTHWYDIINKWIVDKAAESIKWDENEQLQKLEVDSTQNCSISRSFAYRSTDSIELFHLWIKIPIKNDSIFKQ